jgi:hypothetical protein
MSDLVSPRFRALADAPRRIRRARPIPIGYGLLFSAVISMAMWAGLALAFFRLWPF